MTKKTLIPLTFTQAGYTIPAGTELELTLDRDAIRSTYNGRAVRFGYSHAQKRFGAPFTKAPSLAKLEKMSDDGIARTPTGKKTEPDGIAEDGSPSWLLVLGLI